MGAASILFSLPTYYGDLSVRYCYSSESFLRELSHFRGTLFFPLTLFLPGPFTKPERPNHWLGDLGASQMFEFDVRELPRHQILVLAMTIRENAQPAALLEDTNIRAQIKEVLDTVMMPVWEVQRTARVGIHRD
jgi:hypothetical protein